jgi:hypothetical protein
MGSTSSERQDEMTIVVVAETVAVVDEAEAVAEVEVEAVTPVAVAEAVAGMTGVMITVAEDSVTAMMAGAVAMTTTMTSRSRRR